MNSIAVIIIVLLSFSAIANEKKNENYKREKKQEVRKKYYPESLAMFDVTPLNAPVKESVAKFLLKVPNGFDIDEVYYQVRNAGRIFEKVKPHQKINLINGPQGKELQISISKLPSGFYQLFVKVRDRQNREHEYKNKYKDHVIFVVDHSLEVLMPNEKLNNKTIAGIDSDGDGIRDDIQRWINETYSDQPQIKMSMRQMAMGKQLELLSVADRTQSIAASKKYLLGMDCLGIFVSTDAMSSLLHELDSRMLNTKDRLDADIKSNSNFSGQSISLPNNGEEELSHCDFDLYSF